MGGTQGKEASAQGKEPSAQAPAKEKMSEVDEMSHTMLAMASELYRQYHTQFSDVNLCKRLGLAVAEKLNQFDKITLKEIVDNQNSGITLKPVLLAKSEFFEMDGYSELPDYFLRKTVSMPEAMEENKITIPYITKHILDVLKKQKGGHVELEQELAKLLQMEQKEEKAPDIAELQEIFKSILPEPVVEPPREVKEVPELLRELPLAPRDKEYQDKRDREYRERQERRLKEQEKREEKEQQIPEEMQNVIEPKHSKLDKLVDNIKEINAIAPTPKPLKKHLTKQDLCNAIANHYMVRANLVAAIASALPLNNTGFCQERINALEKGELCLPSNYEVVQSMPKIKASSLLSRYINNFRHKRCENAKGIMKKLKVSQLNESNEMHKKAD